MAGNPCQALATIGLNAVQGVGIGVATRDAYPVECLLTLTVAETEDATDGAERDQSWSAARLGGPYRNEVGDWHRNEIVAQE